MQPAGAHQVLHLTKLCPINIACVASNLRSFGSPGSFLHVYCARVLVRGTSHGPRVAPFGHSLLSAVAVQSVQSAPMMVKWME
jgi:hypothetical protein